MKRRRAVFAIAILAAATAACQLLVGIGGDHFSVAPDAAAPDAEVPDAPFVDLCAHANPPVKPPGEDSDTEHHAFVFATEVVDLRGRTATNEIVGYDLDGVCTCFEPAGQTARAGSTSCAPSPKAPDPRGCDWDGGVDNAVVSIIDSLGNLPVTDTLRAQTNSAFTCGSQSILFYLTGYNGRANDPNVGLQMLRSTGIHESHGDAGEKFDDGGCGFIDPDGGPFRAKFDLTDRWALPSNEIGFTNGELVIPVAVVPILSGWVTNFQLVVDIRERAGGAAVPVAIGGGTVEMSSGIIVARLQPVDENGVDLDVDGGTIASPDGGAAGFRLVDGVLAGRASTTSLLSSLGALRLQSGDGGYACDEPFKTVVYDTLKTYVCNGADSVSSRAGDFDGGPCDAISLAVAFSARPASISHTPVDPQPRTPGCGPGFSDTCDNAGDP